MKKNIYFLPASIVLLCLIHFSHQASGQDQTMNEKYAQNPVWIKMMDDPNTNYYEAIKAFDEYWKNRKKPSYEEEEMEEGNLSPAEREKELQREKEKDKNVTLSVEEIKMKNEAAVMKYQVKRFKQWRREVKPFVQEDGRILNDEERMNIWLKQQEEMKKQK